MADAVQAQVLHVGRWSGSLTSRTELTREEIDTRGTGRSEFDRRYADEQLTLRNSGLSLWDPRLVNLTAGVTVGLAQDWSTSNGESTYRDAVLSGYDLFLTTLDGQPFSLNVFASRNQSIISRELAGSSDIVAENRGVTLIARRLYIPSRLTFRQETFDDESRVTGVLTRHVTDSTIVTYEGQRGWVDRELLAGYEFVDTQDDTFPALSHRKHDAHLGYSVDFGEELNRHWDSRLAYSTISGVISSTLWTANESLRIDHTDRFRTGYRYSFLRSESNGVDTTTHEVGADLQYQLYRSLTTTADVDALRQTLPKGEKDIVRGRGTLAYTKALPFGGRLNASVGPLIQYEDDRFTATQSQVSQETHSATTPAALPIALANVLVVQSSIVVTKIAVGPLPPGCLPPPGPPTPLTLGVDYTVLSVGDVTEIVPIPCAGTAAGINPGDTIAVDYAFTVAPAIAFTTLGWHGGASIDYHWIRLFGEHDQSNQTLVSGHDDRFLDDRRSDLIGLELRHDDRVLGGSLTGEAHRFRSTRISFDSVRVAATANAELVRLLTLLVTADDVITNFTDQHRQTDSQSIRASLTYSNRGVSAEASAGYRRFKDTLQPEDDILDARILVQWVFRKLEITPMLQFIDRQHGPTDSREYRATLQTIRRF